MDDVEEKYCTGNARPLPNRDYLRECFEVDPSVPSGLRWKRRPINHFKNLHGCNTWNAQQAGKAAGRLLQLNGYFRVGLDYQQYLTHRIVFSLATDQLIPASLHIDHVDGNLLNNNPNNLRLATNAQNMQNRTRLELRNSSGVTGVSFNNVRKTWEAWIYFQGKKIHLGYFSTFEKAVLARRDAELRYYREFAPPFDESVLLPPMF